MAITTIIPDSLPNNGEGSAELQGTGFFVTDSSITDLSAIAYTGDVTLVSGNTIAQMSSDTVVSTAAVPSVLPEVFDVRFDIVHNDSLSGVPYGNHYMASVEFEDTSNSLNTCKGGIYFSEAEGILFKIENDTALEQVGGSLEEVIALRFLKTPLRMIMRVIKTGGVEEDRLSIPYAAASSNAEIIVDSKTLYVNTFNLSGITYSPAVFLEDHPQFNIVVNSDTSIDFNVPEMPAGDFDLSLFLQDLSVQSLPAVMVIDAFTQKQESFNTDMAITVYGEAGLISLQKLFSDRDGFRWDEDYFSTDDLVTDDNRIPVLWDPQTFGLSSDTFKSGMGFGRDIALKYIKKFYKNGKATWLPAFNHGHYYEALSQFYLYSNESVVDKMDDLVTSDGRSVINLKYSPKIGIPITVATFRRDSANSVIPLNQFSQTGKFRGIITTGKEADTEGSNESIDTTYNDFLLIRDEDNIERNFHLGSNLGPGEITIQLPAPIIDRCYPIFFSRIDIFLTQKPMGTLYGQEAYNTFTYGQPLTDPGDWSVHYESGTLKVFLDKEVPDLGFITYHRNYPAKLEFTRKIFSNIGSGIEIPTLLNLDQMDKLGVISGAAGQLFNLSQGFPIVDKSTAETVDTSNFKLFLFNPNTSVFDTSWTRVITMLASGPSEKVYTLDSDTGEVQFGDGIHGQVPQKYLVVYAVYLPVPRVEYEPTIASDDFIGNINLSPENIAIPAGVLSVSNKEIIPAFIRLDFASKAILSNEFSILGVQVFGSLNEPVYDQEVEIEVTEGLGSLRESIIKTNLNGYQETLFFPEKTPQAIGVPAYFNQIGETGHPNIANDLFFTINMENDALRFAGDILSPIEDVYFFKIIDDPTDIEGLRFNYVNGSGGRYEAMIDGAGDPIRAIQLAQDVAIFDFSLEQNHNPLGPNYNPELVGYMAVSKYTVKVQASLKFRNTELKSNIAIVTIDLPMSEKGVYTVPTLPFNFDSSTIDRATYLRKP